MAYIYKSKRFIKKKEKWGLAGNFLKGIHMIKTRGCRKSDKNSKT